MIKKMLLIFTLILCMTILPKTTIWAEEMISVNWEKNYDIINDGDYLLRHSAIIEKTPDNGYLVLATLDGQTGTYGQFIGDTVLLIKIDSSDNIVWEKVIPHGTYDYNELYVKEIDITKDGGCIVAGYEVEIRTSGSYPNVYYETVDQGDGVLFKYDKDGELEWKKTYDSGDYIMDYLNSVQQTQDGGYIIVGNTGIKKLNTQGETEWNKDITTDDEYTQCVCKSVIETQNGEYIIGGYNQKGLLCDGSIIKKLDKNGDEQFEKHFEGNSNPSFYHIQQTSDGGYLVKGETYSTNEGSKDWLVKLDENFNIEFEKYFEQIKYVNEISNNEFFVITYNDDTYCLKFDAQGNCIDKNRFNYFISDAEIISEREFITCESRDYAKSIVLRKFPINKQVSCIEWEKTFGGSGEDLGKFVQCTTDGGNIIVGTKYVDDFFAKNVYLIKTDKNGNKEWEKTFGGSGSDSGEYVQQTSEGGYIIVGTKYSNSVLDKDVYLIKTDQTGNKQWEKTFGGCDAESGKSVQQTTDGGYIVVGDTYSYGPGNKDVYLIKTDPNGNKQWEKYFGSSEDDCCKSLLQTDDEGYLILGTYKEGSFPKRNYINLMKTDKEGIILWEKNLGYNSISFDIKQVVDGGYIVIGGDYNNEVCLIRINADGNQQWKKTFDLYCSNYEVYSTKDNGYLLIGNNKSYSSKKQDVRIVKTDYHGNKLWEKYFGENDNCNAYSIQQTGDGRYIIVGDIDTNCNGDVNVYLAKLNLVITDGEAVETDKVTLEIGYGSGDNIDHVTQNLILPVNGEYGTTISWASSNPTVINKDGMVIRPTLNDEAVTIIAKISRGNFFDTKEFNVIVKKDSANIIGDFDNNGVVDISDLSTMAKYYGTKHFDSDLNKDELVDLYDLVILSKKINEN